MIIVYEIDIHHLLSDKFELRFITYIIHKQGERDYRRYMIILYYDSYCRLFNIGAPLNL